MNNQDLKTEPLNIFIGIGEIVEGRENQILRIPALGSCVGLVVYPKDIDREKKIALMAHIMLPRSSLKTQIPVVIKTEAKYADKAIPFMLKRLESYGHVKSSLVAKLVGGARMFRNESKSFNIGQENIITVKKLLKEEKIPILKKYTGGERGVSVKFYVETYTLIIHPTGKIPIIL